MNKSLTVLATALLINLVSGTGFAQSALEEIGGIALEDKIFETVDENRMLLLASSEEAERHLSAENFKKLSDQVDFDTQRVVVFAWRGSGRDRISYSIAESWPEQISFDYERGMTRDLRSHTKIFALRSNVSCTVGGNAIELNPERQDAAKEFARIEVYGTLNSLPDGHYSITANELVFKLSLREDPELMESAKGLNNKKVLITGNLVAVDGQQTAWQIEVSTMDSN